MRFAKDAPVIGLVLQRSHLVTGDEGHYSGVVASLEAQGAKVRGLSGVLFFAVSSYRDTCISVPVAKARCYHVCWFARLHPRLY